MELVFLILKNFVVIILDLLNFAMLVRAIFSWFDPEGENRINQFLYMLTEPVVTPIRSLCYKMNWFQQTPIDIPYLITVLLLYLVSTFIRMI